MVVVVLEEQWILGDSLISAKPGIEADTGQLWVKELGEWSGCVHRMLAIAQLT